MKAERPVGTQLFGQGKKDPAKAGESTAKAQSSKAPSKKARQKPQEPKKVFHLHLVLNSEDFIIQFVNLV